MEPNEFEQTAEFKYFRREMRKVIRVPKSELDELVNRAKEESPRNGNPDAPGRKRKIERRRK
jgi:hypothetical protein